MGEITLLEGFPLPHIYSLKEARFTILENPKGVAGMTLGALRGKHYLPHFSVLLAVPCLGMCHGLPSTQPVFCHCAQIICLGVLVLDFSDSFILLLREWNYALMAWTPLLLLWDLVWFLCNDCLLQTFSSASNWHRTLWLKQQQSKDALPVHFL